MLDAVDTRDNIHIHENIRCLYLRCIKILNMVYSVNKSSIHILYSSTVRCFLRSSEYVVMMPRDFNDFINFSNHVFIQGKDKSILEESIISILHLLI